MAGKPAITKAEILDVAYARAQQDGLGVMCQDVVYTDYA